MSNTLIGSSEAAKVLGCSRRTVHRLVARGALRPADTAPGGPYGTHLFKRTAVEALARKRGGTSA